MEKGNFLGINWKVRAKNPQFWLQIFLGVAVPIGTYFGVTGKDITSWNVLFGLIGQAISNPYVLAMVVVSVYNAINDPSTKGIKDGDNASEYVKPSQRADYGTGGAPIEYSDDAVEQMEKEEENV
ncbi:MAG: phage holin family protein [Mammaliicoccus vitulinus]